MKIRLLVCTLSVCLSSVWSMPARANATDFTLENAISTAIKNDPWLTQSHAIEQSLQARGIGESRLPNPSISLSMLNLPTDGFDFNQEPMTQIRAGVSQQFARGDTLELRRQYREQQAAEHPYLRANRRALVTQNVSEIWLDGFLAAKSYELIAEYRPLFDKLADSIGANYASLVGNARQQDIIRAELELVQLDDRLLALDIQHQKLKADLLQWLMSEQEAQFHYAQIEFPNEFEPIVLSAPQAVELKGQALTYWLAEKTQQHPLMLANQQRLIASDAQVEIEKQHYQPQWGVNASYAMRQDEPSGAGRADFFSIGVTVDVPLLSEASIDSQVASAVHVNSSIRTESKLIQRELIAKGQRALSTLNRLERRKALYHDEIIPQMTQQSEAALAAYTNDDGNFIDVVLARITELDARLAVLEIDIEYNKTLARLNYVLHQTEKGSAQ